MASISSSRDASQNEEPPEEPIPSPSHLDGIAYLYGHPLLNSLSPPLHQTIYNALGLRWSQFPLSRVYATSKTYPPPYTISPPVQKFVRHIRDAPKFVGSSVTMPWKVKVMEHLDDLTEEARQIGACNTIFLRHDQKTNRRLLVGTNTDCIGIREAVFQNTSSKDIFKGKPGLIFGGGGTARAAIYAMRKWLGCSKIYIVNRDKSEIEAILREDRQRPASNLRNVKIIPVYDLVDLAGLEEYPAIIVSAIPNLPPRSADEIRARRILEGFLTSESKGAFLEMCYHPRPWTELATLASRFGWNVILGSEALIWQGVEQAKLWTGTDIVEVPGLIQQIKNLVERAIEERVAPKVNL
ncbi:hypothetical protein AJ79_08798 [Helicocarpus griseus UAMH5409]|uniref:Shikimate dehydrogenase substrate binding N-terminal domain-containing protein n=1 Tax=Helicocarpus griseus UAMH5409 TaxID=1447875 RepID=A0A2B7WH29_9EURO|nr:hypothetical protein AJ79_08798 [Helicocarpus griseus UAMH5409]